MKLKKLFSIILLFAGGIFVTGFFMVNSNSDGEQQTRRKAWVAPEWADTLTNPVAGDTGVTAAGQKIFANTCALCHGKTGKGNGPGGKGLTPPPKNLTSEKVQQQTDGAIFWKITTGNLPMASYENVFTEQQRWQLVNYIRKLAEQADKQP